MDWWDYSDGVLEVTGNTASTQSTFAVEDGSGKKTEDTGILGVKGVNLLRYPITLGDGDDGQNNYILFNIWAQTSTPRVLLKEGSQTSQGLAAYKSPVAGGGAREEASVSGKGSTLVAVNQNDNSNRQASFIDRGTQRINTAVAIYMPGNYKVTQSPSWESIELSTGYALEAGYRVAQQKTLESVKNAVTAKLGTNIAGAFDSAFGSSYQTLYELQRSKAVNRFVEVAFKSMANRTYTFDFTFTPISEEEALQVRKIIRAFRYHSAPNFTGDKAYMTYPDEFDISFYRIPEVKEGKASVAIENTKIPRINRCVCTSVDVTFGTSDWYTFKDGHATEIKLSLSFTEMTMLTKNLIQGGY